MLLLPSNSFMDTLKKKKIVEFIKHLHWLFQQLMLMFLLIASLLVGMDNFGLWSDLPNSGSGQLEASAALGKALLCFLIATVAFLIYVYRRQKYMQNLPPKDGDICKK